VPEGSQNLNFTNAKNWMFPFTRGDMRAHDTAQMNVGENELTDDMLWSADRRMPLPGARNLFTYFGGTVEVNPTLSGGRLARNGIIQHKWVPEAVNHTQINDNYGQVPNANCVDVQAYGKYTDKNNAVQGSMVAGSDGICDLQQALQLSRFNWDTSSPGNPRVPSGHAAQLRTDVPKTRHLVQMIRGFCYVTDASGDPIFEPSDTDCSDNETQSDNHAHLGGVVRSSPSVVTPSAKVIDKPSKPRPTVAYVGGWDGQLHAIYVSGGSGYEGLASTRNYMNPSAASTFTTKWNTEFRAGRLPPAGTELWSFMPATQLPMAASNNARVDSSPAVRDIFGDLDGSGRKDWYTVLVVSLGESSREVVALDVSNPLEPVLLWDVVGGNAQVGSFPDFPGVSMSDPSLGGAASPLVWNNARAYYDLPPATDPGRLTYPTKTYAAPYDYAELGGASAVRIGNVLEGAQQSYIAFLASSSSGVAMAPSKGMVVVALDVATGQKIW
jgi:type IV pilus assembly protein PilY1